MYDFNCCKLCAKDNAIPTYTLKDSTVYVCAACGFHFIDHLDSMPPDTPDDAPPVLDRKSSDYIDGKLIANRIQLTQNLELVKQYLPLSGAHCLDIGAGAGLFSHLLAEAGGVPQGIEPQKIFREFALKRFGIVLNGEIIDGRRWQHDCAGFFDCVTLWDVIEHVNFPAETLRDAYNVTKAGGWLFLDTPRRDSLFYKIAEWSYRFSNGSKTRIFESIYSPLPFRHKQLFTLQQLTLLLETIGFTVICLNSSFFMPHNKTVLVCRKPL